MQNGILQTRIENRSFVLDPRTKLILLITMSTFVLGGMGSESASFLTPCLCVLPLFLLTVSKKYKSAATYAGIYSAAYLTFALFGPHTSGCLHFLLLGAAGIITKLMPSLTMGIYVISTTTVSEFTASMQRLHLSEKLIIPLSVMFRFFPTVADEFASINAAMKMRGISFGGKNAGKMLEYRFIPLMTCSVKIGDELSAAALTRGLGGTVKRTNICRIGFHLQDMIMILLCAVPFGCLFLDACGAF
ncbi:MAG: energy-coupling factor transporter transmembrane protein EcfT [Oscillospiraceae bacterium]|jgi:energy-coupling factor transport system permease protein|nr:energy-coupling factor transporter transmembrane protein EcfT [Oscillospiraceae bacterium]